MDSPAKSSSVKSCSCRGCGKQTKRTLQEFGDVTTLHGIRYITEPRANLCERLCWTLAILMSAVWCSLEMGKLYARWQESPVITVFAHKSTPVTSVPFPAVTICPESKVGRNFIDVEANFTWLQEQLKGNGTLNQEDTVLAQAVGTICMSQPTLPSDFRPTLETIDKVYEISPSLDSVFHKCHFHYQPFDCAALFLPILTDFGLCFTFNMMQLEEIFKDNFDSSIADSHWDGRYTNMSSTWNLADGYRDLGDVSGTDRLLASMASNEYPRREHLYLGATSGLEVTLKSRVGSSQQVCSESNSDNFRVSLHSPAEFPLPRRKYFHVSPNSQSMVAVRPDRMETDSSLKPPKYTAEVRNCIFQDEGDMFILKEITKQNCIIDELIQSVVTKCNCTFPFIPLKGDNNTSMEFCMSSLKGCRASLSDIWKCLPSCHELQYRYHINIAQYEPAEPRNNETKDIQYSSLIVYYETSTFFTMRKSELYGITDFIANCGGLLGLFTGFSVISALEILYFACLRFMCRVNEHRRDKIAAQPSADEPDSLQLDRSM